MAQGSALANCQNLLDSWLASLAQNQDKLREYLTLLDLKYPSWKAWYDLAPGDFTKHDARREFFRYLSVILQNVRLSFIFMREQLCDPTWWVHCEGQFSGQQAAETLLGYQTMARQYSVDQIAAITEQTLTSIAFSGHGPFTLTVSSGLENVHSYVLSKTSLSKKFTDQFEILRLVRNTIHSNGIFCPQRGGNVVREHSGNRYIFEVGKPVGWYDNDMMALMFEWISDAMWEIVNSPQVNSITYTPVFQPRPSQP